MTITDYHTTEILEHAKKLKRELDKKHEFTEIVNHHVICIENYLYKLVYCSDCPKFKICDNICIDAIQGWIYTMNERAYKLTEDSLKYVNE